MVRHSKFESEIDPFLNLATCLKGGHGVKNGMHSDKNTITWFCAAFRKLNGILSHSRFPELNGTSVGIHSNFHSNRNRPIVGSVPCRESRNHRYAKPCQNFPQCI